MIVLPSPDPIAIRYQDEMFIRSARCINIWSGVDDIIFQLFIKILKIGPEIGSVVFYQTDSIAKHVELVTASINVICTDKICLEWSEVIKDFSALNKVRNQLAHNPMLYRSPALKIDHAAEIAIKINKNDIGYLYFGSLGYRALSRVNKKSSDKDIELKPIKLKYIKQIQNRMERIEKSLVVFLENEFLQN